MTSPYRRELFLLRDVEESEPLIIMIEIGTWDTYILMWMKYGVCVFCAILSQV